MEKKQYSAIDIAKYVVSKCSKDAVPISNLQLQKILFAIQRQYLKDYDCELFVDSIEAWRFGPVIPTVYYHFCGFGGIPIDVEYNKLEDIKAEDKVVIDTVVEEKRCLRPWDLVEETHKDGGAWAKIYNDGEGNKKEIPTDVIKELG